MSQILIVDDQETLKALVKLSLLKCTGYNVLSQSNAEISLAFMETDFNIDLIICRPMIQNENTALLLINFLKKNNLTTPILTLGEMQSDYAHLQHIKSEASWEEILKKTGEILKVEIDLEKNIQTQSFNPVGINYFLSVSDIPIGCDVYIGVKKGTEVHYVKRFHADEIIGREIIEKYKSSGLHQFYITQEQFKHFIDHSMKHLLYKLKSEKMSSETRHKLNSDSINLMSERIKSLGIDQTTVELVESSVNSMKESLGEKNALSNFMETLQSNKGSYGYQHSFLTCLILHRIAKKFYWFSHKIKEKMTLISYFHDIALPEELVAFNSEEAMMRADLKTSEKDLINNHALLSANIVGSFKFVPEDVASIIREHHGSLKGIGFHSHLSIAVSPISQMFIVVEDFVDEVLKLQAPPEKKDIEHILDILRPKYTKLTYEKTHAALKEMFS